MSNKEEIFQKSLSEKYYVIVQIQNNKNGEVLKNADWFICKTAMKNNPLKLQ